MSYTLGDTSSPHVTLKVIARGVKQRTWVRWWNVSWSFGNWTPPHITNTTYATLHTLHNTHYTTLFTIYKNIVVHVSHTTLTLEQMHLSPTDTQTLLDLLSDTLWSTGSTDVGLLNVPPASIPVKPNSVPIYRHQYPLRHDEIEGIVDTMMGLLNSGYWYQLTQIGTLPLSLNPSKVNLPTVRCMIWDR